MRMIMYDSINIEILAPETLSKEDQRDTRRISTAICCDIQRHIEEEMIPDHLKKKVKVIVK